MDADFKLPVGQVVRGVVEGLTPAELKDCSVIAYVRNSQVSGGGFDGTSNAFEIHQLRKGKVTLRLRVKKRNPDLVYPAPVEVDAPTSGVRLVVSRAYNLRVKIVGADPKQAQVRFYEADGTRPPKSAESLLMYDWQHILRHGQHHSLTRYVRESKLHFTPKFVD